MFNFHFLKMLFLWIVIIGAGIYTLFLIDDGKYVLDFFSKEVEHLDSFFHPGSIKDIKDNSPGGVEYIDGGGFEIER